MFQKLEVIKLTPQCTLQLQLYRKSGKGCIVVVYSTPAIMNIIIRSIRDSVVDHYTVFVPTKSVIYGTLTLLLMRSQLGFIFLRLW